MASGSDDGGQLVPLLSLIRSNLFSLASGGPIFVRDPNRTLVEQQLNGGKFCPMSNADWELILPMLEEESAAVRNHHRGPPDRNGRMRKPASVYRKVVPGRRGRPA